MNDYSKHFGKQIASKYVPKESLSETILTGLLFIGTCAIAVLIAALALKGAT